MKDILDEQEKIIDGLWDAGGFFTQLGIAEIEYDSVFAKELLLITSQGTSVTLSKDIIKGLETIKTAQKNLNEAIRKVEKSKAKIKFLQNQYEAEKKGIDLRDKITGATQRGEL
jgi:hypothetical protein